MATADRFPQRRVCSFGLDLPRWVRYYTDMRKQFLPVIKVSKDLRSRLDAQVQRMKQSDAEGATLAGLIRQLLLDGLARLEEDSQ